MHKMIHRAVQQAGLWLGLFFLIPGGAIPCIGQSATPEAREPAPPNIVLIFTDDQGYADVGVFGASDIPTPNLDGLASEGLRLTQFYVAQPVCSASRAGLLTGCYPNRIGIHNALMPNSPVGLNPQEQTLAELLRDRGYATAIFGKWHLGDHPDFLASPIPTTCGLTTPSRAPCLTLARCRSTSRKRWSTPSTTRPG